MNNQMNSIPAKNLKFSLHLDFFEELSSPHTRLSYQNDIMQFLEYICIQFEDLNNYQDIEKKHIVRFRNYLQQIGGKEGDPCAPKTISRKLAALSSYFRFLSEKNIITTNPVSSIKRPRSAVMVPTNALTKDQVKDLISSIDENKKAGKMHKALLIMFFTTGLRKSEILNLRRKDYSDFNQHKIIRYHGKGGKKGQKILHPICIDALEEYLNWMKNQTREHIPEDWLFQPTQNPFNPTMLNKPLNPKTINEILDHYAMKINLTFKISPHSARATFIGELLNAGVDIYAVAQEVNHSSVKTTQEYDKRRRNFLDSPVYKLKF